MVFCEKNCLGSSAHEDFLDFRTSFSRTVDCGQIDVEDAALVDLTLHFDMAEMLFDNAKNGGQTQARAFAFLVGWHERDRIESRSLAPASPRACMQIAFPPVRLPP